MSVREIAEKAGVSQYTVYRVINNDPVVSKVTQSRIKGIMEQINYKPKKRKSNGRLSCTGETKLLMTDFGVTPPVFMMGVMKTGDEITINYKMNYKT